jgi:hypothetical protein
LSIVEGESYRIAQGIKEKGEHTMQAIKTKYLGATNHRGARVKAMCNACQVTIPWSYDLGAEANHDSARKSLQLKLAHEGSKKFGYSYMDDPWLRPMVGGALPNNEGYAFVFVGDWK